MNKFMCLAAHEQGSHRCVLQQKGYICRRSQSKTTVDGLSSKIIKKNLIPGGCRPPSGPSPPSGAAALRAAEPEA